MTRVWGRSSANPLVEFAVTSVSVASSPKCKVYLNELYSACTNIGMGNVKCTSRVFARWVFLTVETNSTSVFLKPQTAIVVTFNR